MWISGEKKSEGVKGRERDRRKGRLGVGEVVRNEVGYM